MIGFLNSLILITGSLKSSNRDMPKTFKNVIQNSTFGPIVLVWKYFADSPQIIRVIISSSKFPADREAAQLFPDSIKSSCPAIDILSSKIKAFIAGEKIDFSPASLDLQNCTEFQEKVLLTTQAIPVGKVCSYGTLAAHIGTPKASRAVGTALARNPFPILIPCHRVIQSDRTLGGFGGGLKMKRVLLEIEQVSFKRNNRISRHHILHKIHKN